MARIFWSRRVVNGLVLGSTATAMLALGASAAQAEAVKVAAIYTVPVEQQWVSRIHKALNAAVERGEITYTFSEKLYVMSPRSTAAFSALWMRLTHCCSTGTV